MFVDLINSQIKRKENINPEIAVCGGAPTSPHLFKQMLQILKVKKVKVNNYPSLLTPQKQTFCVLVCLWLN